jgi:hypothetical protein
MTQAIPQYCVVGLSTHDFDCIPRVPCGEPVLGPLRVCYDHATLCLKCREEPTNPGTVCEVCASEVTP